jgi:hypothetical protein
MKKEFNLSTKLHFDEIIDFGISLYKNNFTYFITIMAIYYIPFIAILIPLMGSMSNEYAHLMSALSQAPVNPDAVFGVISKFMLYGSLFFMAYLLMSTLSGAAIIKATEIKVAGGTTDAKDVAVTAIKKIFPLIITSLIASIMMGIGFIFCIIPFFILAVYLIYIAQAIMLEDTYGFGAIGRSFTMTSGNFWETLLIPLVFYLAYFFISSVISYAIFLTPYIKMIQEIVANQGQVDPEFLMRFYSENIHLIIIETVATSILYMLLSPILSITLTLKYINIRNIKEGTSLVQAIEHEKRTSV